MKTPADYLDEMSDDSLSNGQSKLEWLEFLMELRDELEIKISSVSHEVNQGEKS